MMRLFGFCPRNNDTESDSDCDENQNHEILIYDENEYLPKNKVTFSDQNDVYIIPNKESYSRYKCALWWSHCELDKAQHSSYKEVQKLVSLCPGLQFHKARKVLYQSSLFYELNYYQT